MLKAVQSLPDADLREQQIEEARRLAAQEGTVAPRRTLSVKSGFEGRSRAPMAKKQPAVPKGHEAFLKALEISGAEVDVEKCDGTLVRGVVKHSDKYTISMRTVVDGAPGCDRVVKDRVIFKHDISEFSAITPRQPVPDSKTEEGHAV